MAERKSNDQPSGRAGAETIDIRMRMFFRAVAKSRTHPYGQTMTRSARTTRKAWLKAGFAALAEAGPEALKAEVMARRLGTTKGSFYWHFKDVADFHAGMMADWEARSRAGIAAAPGDGDHPRDRLRRLGRIVAEAADGAAEPAIRAWAHGNAAVAEAVARVDRRRLDDLAALLGALGLTNPEFARLIQAGLIGLEEMAARDGGEIAAPLSTLIDLILALE